jgi:hypothetical protein
LKRLEVIPTFFITCLFCQLPPTQGGAQHLFEGKRTMIASDDVVFAWAIGKALLIVIVSFGVLIYAAWAVTGQKPGHVGIPKGRALKYESSLKAGKVLLIAHRTAEVEPERRTPARISAEEIKVHGPGQPAATA